MRRLFATLLCVVATTNAAWAADEPSAQPPKKTVVKKAAAKPEPATKVWSVTQSTEVRYFSWQSNRGVPVGVPPASNGGNGAQLYVPYALQLVGRPHEDVKIELLGRGGWVWARQSTAGLTGEVATTTDTVASGTFTYLGLNGISPFAALSLNIPTGRSALFGTAANARMDPDMVDIATFGEGFNMGPTIGANIPITASLIVTASAGYTRRGQYDRENSLALAPQTPPTVQTPTLVDPGDVTTIYGSIGYQDDTFAAKLTGSISEETATTENGLPLYRAGRRYLATGTWAFTWPNVATTTLTAAASHSNRNDVLFLGAPDLIKEVMNTNSNLYRVGVQTLFALEKFVVGPTGSFLHRDHNGYDSTTLQFVPAKDRWAAGVLMRFAQDEHVTFNARLEHVWTRENDNPALNGQKFSVLANGFVAGSSVPVVLSTGWQAVVGVTGRF
jgi:hypothetical protein